MPTAPLVTSTGPTVEYLRPRANRWLGVNRVVASWSSCPTSLRPGWSRHLSLPSNGDPHGARLDAEASVAHWHPVTSPIQTATATLHTNRGDIKIALFGNHAPKTVANFVGLAQGTKDYSTENASGSTSGPVLRRRRSSTASSTAS